MMGHLVNTRLTLEDFHLIFLSMMQNLLLAYLQFTTIVAQESQQWTLRVSNLCYVPSQTCSTTSLSFHPLENIKPAQTCSNFTPSENHRTTNMPSPEEKIGL
jgi:hypothetical protein